MISTLSHLECGACGRHHDPGSLAGCCTDCGRPLLALYDLERARETLTPRSLESRRPDLWRYREVLPDAEPSSLGAGWTPFLPARRLGAELGVPHLYVKDEAQNPTGSFKARGMAVAVPLARQLGAVRLAVPSAGYAGLALAAFAARAGLPSEVFFPEDTPQGFLRGAAHLGATVHTVPGHIADCARRVREGSDRWFDLSTLREPYRLEGKKTMGYELFEQMGGRLPQWIVYPTGGGTGLIGMWKAFGEMEALGWTGAQRPRLVAVQPVGCCPIVRAFDEGATEAEPFPDPRTIARGLRVPQSVGDRLILRALRETRGLALAVSEVEMLRGARSLATREGILAGPEGGATLAGLQRLTATGQIAAGDSVVLWNTGSGLPYLRVMESIA